MLELVVKGRSIFKFPSNLRDAVTLREQFHLQHGNLGLEEMSLQDGGFEGSAQLLRSKSGQKVLLEKSSHFTQTMMFLEKS